MAFERLDCPTKHCAKNKELMIIGQNLISSLIKAHLKTFLQCFIRCQNVCMFICTDNLVGCDKPAPGVNMPQDIYCSLGAFVLLSNCASHTQISRFRLLSR